MSWSLNHILAVVSREVGSVLLTLFGLLLVTFFIGRVIPIDPVTAIVGERASQATYLAVRAQLGLDLPLYEQFYRYAVAALHGDFGNSLITSNPVIVDIAHFFPATLELATAAAIIGIGLGIPTGVAAAVARGRWPDQLVRLFGLAGFSIPTFFLGLMGLLLFYGKLNWAPGPGRLDLGYEGLVDPVTGSILIDSLISGDTDVFWNAIRHLILPSSLLGLFCFAYVSRMTRAMMLQQLGQEYIIVARVKGLRRGRIIWRHAFANILVPLITVVALTYAMLLEGSVVTETVFAWPGIGAYMTNSLRTADMDAVLGGTLVIGTCFVLINMFSDLLYNLLDPRVRSS